MIRVLTVLVTLAIMVGCSRHAFVREEMTWKCESGRAAQHLMSQPVTFFFVKNPAIGELHAGPGLCDQLKAAGKPVVAVEYDVWGNSIDSIRGFRAVKIDGKPFKDAIDHKGGDSLGPNPLQAPFVR